MVGNDDYRCNNTLELDIKLSRLWMDFLMIKFWSTERYFLSLTGEKALSGHTDQCTVYSVQCTVQYMYIQ